MTKEEYVTKTREDVRQLIRALAVIPAPSHHEEKRVAFLQRFLASHGVKAEVDEAQNVIWPLGVTDDNDVVVIMAHTDIVFGEDVPLELREDGHHFYCPGIGDDTAAVALLLYAGLYMMKKHPRCGVLLVANSCEEGLGNLKGSRAIVDRFGFRIREFLTVDGAPGIAVTRAVGSHRYRVSVSVQGGHSYGDFGRENAIAVLARMIGEIYALSVPEKPGTRTTYNVGTVSGGTTVNSIAQKAEMLCEYRSDDPECLAQMERAFKKIFENAQNDRVSVTAERIGERPSGRCEGEAQQALLEKIRAAYAHIGYGLQEGAGSTDANIPLARGIPAAAIGFYRAGGAHTREELLDLDSLEPAMLGLLTLLENYFE